MLSLFRVGDVAFKHNMNDDNARPMYPAGGRRLQLSAAKHQTILIMTTTDGSEAAFTLAPSDLRRLLGQASEPVTAKAEGR